jgi:phosphate transport system permease protein
MPAAAIPVHRSQDEEDSMSSTLSQTSRTGLGAARAEPAANRAQRTRDEELRLAARVRRFAVQDRLFAFVTFSFAALVMVILGGILVSLFIEAWPALREYGPAFLVGGSWSPSDDVYGALIAIYGTVVTS